MPSPPSPNGSIGRAAGGRFAKGNPGGPGNPFARRVAALRQAVVDALGEDGIAEVVRGLLTAAKAGDAAAAKLLLSYAVGQPTPAVDPDTLDHHERDLADRMRQSISAEEWAKRIDVMYPDLTPSLKPAGEHP